MRAEAGLRLGRNLAEIYFEMLKPKRGLERLKAAGWVERLNPVAFFFKLKTEEGD